MRLFFIIFFFINYLISYAQVFSTGKFNINQQLSITQEGTGFSYDTNLKFHDYLHSEIQINKKIYIIASIGAGNNMGFGEIGMFYKLSENFYAKGGLEYYKNVTGLDAGIIGIFPIAKKVNIFTGVIFKTVYDQNKYYIPKSTETTDPQLKFLMRQPLGIEIFVINRFSITIETQLNGFKDKQLPTMVFGVGITYYFQ